MASVTRAAKVVRSTASACPAGTAHSRAILSNSDSARLISSFSTQGAVVSLSDFSEFEQTSSAKSAVWCAGVERTGRISNNSTSTPRLAHCHAASDPANPAPIILTLGMFYRLLRVAAQFAGLMNSLISFEHFYEMTNLRS